MLNVKQISLLIFVIVSCGSMAREAQGQWRAFSQPSQKGLRLLGQGFSAGYHWRTPGPRTDYYNPYSYHNSNRLSGSGSANIYQGGYQMIDGNQHSGMGLDLSPQGGGLPTVTQPRLPRLPGTEAEKLPEPKNVRQREREDTDRDDASGGQRGSGANGRNPNDPAVRLPAENRRGQQASPSDEWPFSIDQ